VLLISTPHDLGGYVALLGDGSQLGMSIQYAVQPEPGGLAQAFIIGRGFVGDENVAMVLGDNIFYGTGLQDKLDRACRRAVGATCFAYHVKHPHRFGIVEIDEAGKIRSLEEKPAQPKSNLAVTGLYFYDNRVLEIAANLKPSPRGELEITDVNREYLRLEGLHIESLGRGFAWLDTGTPESLLQAASFIETIETRQGLKVACLEEIAFRKRFITEAQFAALAKDTPGPYGEYLQGILSQPE
jgi:glucose-1-phosphate thymidylyltransferase